MQTLKFKTEFKQKLKFNSQNLRFCVYFALEADGESVAKSGII